MKRQMSLLAVPLLALSLAACGAADDASDSPAATAEETTDATDPTEVATETDEESADEGEAETSEEETTSEEATTEEAGEADGSRENPYAVGDTITPCDWELVINSVDLDAAEEVLAENEFNEEPAEGRQFVLVNLDATYNGEDSSNYWIDISTKVVGSKGNTFGDEMDDDCGVVPEDLFNAGEQFAGSTETGNVCVSVPAEQLDGALFLIEESFSFEDNRVFVALD